MTQTANARLAGQDASAEGRFSQRWNAQSSARIDPHGEERLPDCVDQRLYRPAAAVIRRSWQPCQGHQRTQKSSARPLRTTAALDETRERRSGAPNRVGYHATGRWHWSAGPAIPRRREAARPTVAPIPSARGAIGDRRVIEHLQRRGGSMQMVEVGLPPWLGWGRGRYFAQLGTGRLGPFGDTFGLGAGTGGRSAWVGGRGAGVGLPAIAVRSTLLMRTLLSL